MGSGTPTAAPVAGQVMVFSRDLLVPGELREGRRVPMPFMLARSLLGPVASATREEGFPVSPAHVLQLGNPFLERLLGNRD